MPPLSASPSASSAEGGSASLTGSKAGIGVSAAFGAIALISLVSLAVLLRRRRKEQERRKLAASADRSRRQRRRVDRQRKIKETHELQGNYIAQERAELRGEAAVELDDWRIRPELPGHYKFPKRSIKKRVLSAWYGVGA